MTKKRADSANDAWEELLRHLDGLNVVVLMTAPNDVVPTHVIANCDAADVLVILKSTLALHEGRFDVINRVM